MLEGGAPITTWADRSDREAAFKARASAPIQSGNSSRCVGPPRAGRFGLRAQVERTGAENASTRIHLGVSNRRALLKRGARLNTTLTSKAAVGRRVTGARDTWWAAPTPPSRGAGLAQWTRDRECRPVPRLGRQRLLHWDRTVCQAWLAQVQPRYATVVVSLAKMS
jgi:hypothetical protein